MTALATLVLALALVRAAAAAAAATPGAAAPPVDAQAAPGAYALLDIGPLAAAFLKAAEASRDAAAGVGELYALRFAVRVSRASLALGAGGAGGACFLLFLRQY